MDLRGKNSVIPNYFKGETFSGMGTKAVQQLRILKTEWEAGFKSDINWV